MATAVRALFKSIVWNNNSIYRLVFSFVFRRYEISMRFRWTRRVLRYSFRAVVKTRRTVEMSQLRVVLRRPAFVRVALFIFNLTETINLVGRQAVLDGVLSVFEFKTFVKTHKNNMSTNYIWVNEKFFFLSR